MIRTVFEPVGLLSTTLISIMSVLWLQRSANFMSFSAAVKRVNMKDTYVSVVDASNKTGEAPGGAE